MRRDRLFCVECLQADQAGVLDPQARHLDASYNEASLVDVLLLQFWHPRKKVWALSHPLLQNVQTFLTSSEMSVLGHITAATGTKHLLE